MKSGHASLPCPPALLSLVLLFVWRSVFKQHTISNEHLNPNSQDIISIQTNISGNSTYQQTVYPVPICTCFSNFILDSWACNTKRLFYYKVNEKWPYPLALPACCVVVGDVVCMENHFQVTCDFQ
jgi:hypothetical protein